MSLLQPATAIPRAFKGGFFGGGGSGKTLTATLLAIGLSIRYHNRAAIAFVDTEDQSDFMIPICEAEGVPLQIVKSRSFIDMRDALTEAEANGCCALIVDSYSHPARELEEALKQKLNLTGRRVPYHHRDQLWTLWGAWVRQMRASPLHMFLNGRLAFEWDEVEDADGDARSVKVGTKMRGDSDAGYEPDLLVELEAIRTSLVRDRTTKSKRGHMKHAAIILKDRWMALNGKTILWPDLNTYTPGDYEAVYHFFAPHLAHLRLDTPRLLDRPSVARASAELFASGSGESRFAEDARRRTIALEDLHGILGTIYPGTTNEEKRLKAILQKTLFHTRSWTEIETFTPERLETARAVMLHFEAAAPQINLRDEAAVIDLIQSCADLERMTTEQRIAEAVL